MAAEKNRPAMTDRNKKIPSVRTNTLFNVLKTFSTIVFPLITFPYISRILGVENVGKVNFGSSIISYFALLATLGVNAYAVRECSKVRDDREILGKIASQILSINVVTTLLSYACLVLCLLAVPKLQGYQLLIAVQSISILLTTIGADWLNTAMEDFRFIAARTFVFQLIALVCMFLFVRQPEHYFVYAAVSLISSGGANIVNVSYRRRYCRVRFTLHMDWRRHLPPILMMFVMLLAQQILGNLDTTMLGFLKGDTAVGLYSTAVKVINIVTQLTISITWVVLPQITKGYEEKNYAEVNRLLRYALSFTIVLGLPCLAGINMMAGEIIYAIGGAEYMEAANCLRILSISMFWAYVSNIYGNLILLPSNREKQFMTACLISTGVNTVTNAIFIPVWGINAASATTALSSMLTALITMAGMEKEIGFGNKVTLLRAPIVGTMAVMVICIVSKYMLCHPVVRLVTAVGASACVYLIILLILRDEFAESLFKPILRRMIGR